MNTIEELHQQIQTSRRLAEESAANLEANIPLLVRAIATKSGQGRRMEGLLWSVWNDEHKVNLCDTLCGLDPDLAQAVIALVAARAHMAGDADGLIRRIIEQSGSQPPSSAILAPT